MTLPLASRRPVHTIHRLWSARIHKAETGFSTKDPQRIYKVVHLAPHRHARVGWEL